MKPTICCVCLTADRQALTERAIKCFLSQEYSASWMLIYDTGREPFVLPYERERIVHCYVNPGTGKKCIGALRNEANDMAYGGCDVIAHWDSDDWSHSSRLGIQQFNLAKHEAAGFHNLLFLDSRNSERRAWEYDYRRPDRVLGTSLVYLKEAWRDCTFPEDGQTEDMYFMKRVFISATNGVVPAAGIDPPLIAEVHGANTSGVYGVFDAHHPDQKEWRRAPEWDAHCKGRLYP